MGIDPDGVPRNVRGMLLGKVSLTPRLLENLKKARRTHAAADAHGADHVFDAAPFAFDQRVTDHACT
jgi:hypothetical protein